MINFSVSLLEHQDIDLEGSEPAELLELESDNMFTAETPVAYKLHVSSVSGGALVTGEAHTTVSGTCGRCLEYTEEVVSTGELQLFFEIEDEEIIDITEDIRAELLLNLPANLLCDDECAGLCPVCGINLNEHSCDCDRNAVEEEDVNDDEPSPWDALDKLKLKD